MMVTYPDLRVFNANENDGEPILRPHSLKWVGRSNRKPRAHPVNIGRGTMALDNNPVNNNEAYS
jgi:hypothetical protein